MFVERVYAAQGKLHSSSGSREAAPSTEVRAANNDLKHDGITRDVPSLYLDLQVRKSVHELRIEITNSIPTLMIFAPSFILVLGSVTEGAENTFQVMLVLKPYVLLHGRDSSRLSVLENRCASHVHLQLAAQSNTWRAGR
jgi:hypothetical protein